MILHVAMHVVAVLVAAVAGYRIGLRLGGARARAKLEPVLTAYRVKRAVDGSNGRTWDAGVHLAAEEALADLGEPVLQYQGWDGHVQLHQMLDPSFGEWTLGYAIRRSGERVSLGAFVGTRNQAEDQVRAAVVKRTIETGEAVEGDYEIHRRGEVRHG